MQKKLKANYCFDSYTLDHNIPAACLESHNWICEFDTALKLGPSTPNISLLLGVT